VLDRTERPTGATEPGGESDRVGPVVGCTRFAPAPTGQLHLGHVANAIFVWGMAAAAGARVLLRIEDHDRERSRRAFANAIVEDLAWLGFVPDAGPVHQREDVTPYVAAVDRLRSNGMVYACNCTRSSFAAWEARHQRPWRGPGCPGDCRNRRLAEGPSLVLRVALGDGREEWSDRILGPSAGDVALAGDLPIRDRRGNWTYGLCVVVDDLRQSITLVVRGDDLADATPVQIRLARVLGRSTPPAFAHHRLIRKATGAKLSKADGDTGVRELRAAGQRPEDLIGEAAAAIGLIPRPVPVPAFAVRDLLRLVDHVRPI